MKIIINKQSERGFSLIEVMIAVTIFSVGILAVASMQLKSIQGNTIARTQTEASQLLANKAEEINMLPYNATDGHQIDVTEQPVKCGSNETYETSWTVENEADFSVGTSSFKARRVTATIAWNDGNGSRTIDYTFLKVPTL